MAETWRAAHKVRLMPLHVRRRCAPRAAVLSISEPGNSGALAHHATMLHTGVVLRCAQGVAETRLAALTSCSRSSRCDDAVRCAQRRCQISLAVYHHSLRMRVGRCSAVDGQCGAERRARRGRDAARCSRCHARAVWREKTPHAARNGAAAAVKSRGCRRPTPTARDIHPTRPRGACEPGASRPTAREPRERSARPLAPPATSTGEARGQI